VARPVAPAPGPNWLGARIGPARRLPRRPGCPPGRPCPAPIPSCADLAARRLVIAMSVRPGARTSGPCCRPCESGGWRPPGLYIRASRECGSPGIPPRGRRSRVVQTSRPGGWSLRCLYVQAPEGAAPCCRCRGSGGRPPQVCTSRRRGCPGAEGIPPWARRGRQPGPPSRNAAARAMWHPGSTRRADPAPTGHLWRDSPSCHASWVESRLPGRDFLVFSRPSLPPAGSHARYDAGPRVTPR
jgi:hypothetical protein